MEGPEGKARLTLLAILAISAVVVGVAVLLYMSRKQSGEQDA